MTLHARDWFARLSHLRSVHPEWTTEPAAVRDQSGHSGNPRDCPHGAARCHPSPAAMYWVTLNHPVWPIPLRFETSAYE